MLPQRPAIPFCPRLLCAILLACFSLSACSGPAIEASDTPPETFALSLYTRTATQRLTYFEITRSGDLYYAGGRAALQREGELVTKITPQQKQEIWSILIQGKLHEAGAGPLFPEARDTNYDLAFNTGGFDHIVRSVDNDLPALKTLHDYLFKIQATLRYDPSLIAP